MTASRVTLDPQVLVSDLQQEFGEYGFIKIDTQESCHQDIADTHIFRAMGSQRDISGLNAKTHSCSGCDIDSGDAERLSFYIQRRHAITARLDGGLDNHATLEATCERPEVHTLQHACYFAPRSDATVRKEQHIGCEARHLLDIVRDVKHRNAEFL